MLNRESGSKAVIPNWFIAIIFKKVRKKKNTRKYSENILRKKLNKMVLISKNKKK